MLPKLLTEFGFVLTKNRARTSCLRTLSPHCLSQNSVGWCGNEKRIHPSARL